jgi:circadian clock protein KaiC
MKLARSSPVAALRKSPSGVLGFDEITGGGLPRGRTTLLAGGPGCGKTIFALQFLVNGARDFAEPGIFVAFEESSRRIVANAESFGWRLSQLRRKKLLFVVEKTLLASTTASRKAVTLRGSVRMRELRGGDAPRRE